ncbi:Crp/Fnr family transcriptional regulator [Niabella terrae]
MESLFEQLNQYHRLSPQAGQALAACLEEKTLAKNHFLIRRGRVCEHFYFLQQGAVRGFYELESRQVTHWFAFENTFVSSFYSFSTGNPAVEHIQLMEGCILWTITRRQLLGLFDQFPEIERLVRIIYEHYYIRLEERYVNAQFKTAAERYADLITATPHILQRVPLGYIASYLGISQETLSRIRSRH